MIATVINQTAAGLADLLESRLGAPVLDETGLTGGYDFDIVLPEDLKQARESLRAIRPESGAGATQADLPRGGGGRHGLALVRWARGAEIIRSPDCPLMIRASSELLSGAESPKAWARREQLLETREVQFMIPTRYKAKPAKHLSYPVKAGEISTAPLAHLIWRHRR